MTKVLLQYGAPAPDGTYPPVEGVLIWTPTRRRVIAGMPDKIIMPIGFKVPITGGVITVNVAPSGIDWVWRVDELVKGASRVISYRAVPDVEEIDFTDLVGIDPTTLQPMAEPEPIWYSWAEGLALAAGNAEQSAEDSKLAAIESQNSALASATAAKASEDQAAAYVLQAGGHAHYAGDAAFGAGDSMFKAKASEDAAKLSEDAAEAAKADAFLFKQAAETAKAYSEAARDEALAAEALTVSSGNVDGNGHLILTRNDETTHDAGQVVVGLSVVGTTTGFSSARASDADVKDLILDTASGTRGVLNATIASGVAASPALAAKAEKTAEALRAALSAPAAQDYPATTLLARADGSLTATGSLVRELRYTDSEGFSAADFTNDAHFRYDQTPYLRRVFADQSNYVAPPLLPGGSAQAAYYNYSVEFVTAQTNSELEVRLRAASAFMLLRVYVDGRPTTMNALNFNGLSAGQGYNLRLAFPSAKSRNIKIEFGDSTGFGGVYVPNGQTCYRPTAPLGDIFAILEDSYGGGSSFPPDGGTRLDTAAYLAARALGFRRVFNFAVGGTGYVATADNFTTRAAAVAAISPQVVFVGGSINDGTADTPAIRTAVNTVLTALAAVPEVYVSGPSRSASYAGNNTAVRETTLAAGRPYLDPLAPAWLDSTMIGPDGSHPTWAGHQRRAIRIYEGIAARRAPLGYIARPTVSAPVVPPATTGVLVADTFTRADSTEVGSTTTGGLAWTESADLWGIAGNELVATADPAASRVTVETGFTQNKQIVRAKFSAAAGVSGALLAHVGPTGESGYELNRSSSNSYTVRKLLPGGSRSTMVTITGVTAAAGDIGSLTFNTDGTITGTVNGTSVTTAVDTSSRGGRHGFYAPANHAPKFDNFEVEILP